jgi:Tfp pilus assembly protein PilO
MIALQQQAGWTKRMQLILGIGMLVAVLGFYIFVYRPSSHRMAELRQQLAAADIQISKNYAAARDLDSIKRDVVQLKQQIANSRQLPAEQDLSSFIREIAGMAQNARVEKFRCDPQTLKQLELCSELPITLRFAGPFMDVATFLRQAESLPRMMRTRTLSLKSRDGKSGIVDAELAVSVYFGGEQ